ncbi:hypothetical protein J1N35_015513 [Gossypium stocksii]|uniref:O-methyltransferase C-terminal domain-containing protein n=1 Tax=Gossypium stocksii TaxID=47602 RepID=A0A9D3VWF5_9ROSI|nr:hypothetical protein J1N35_015513 [Gossypium stocksii]
MCAQYGRDRHGRMRLARPYASHGLGQLGHVGHTGMLVYTGEPHRHIGFWVRPCESGRVIYTAKANLGRVGPHGRPHRHNCKKAIPRENGKVIVVEIILKEDGSGVLDEIGFIFDLVMIAHTNGKERTEVEWKKILEGGSFSHYKIINIPDLLSIIEAYPDD